MKKMVDISSRGEQINPDWAVNAKNRSTHNTYFTLPIIFIMFSNHFPDIYGHEKNWLLLMFLIAAGGALRQYFVMRLSKPTQSKVYGLLGSNA